MFTLKIPFSTYTGYAKVCREFVKGLDMNRKQFIVKPVNNHVPDNTHPLLMKYLSYEDTRSGVFFGYANGLLQVGSPIKGLYTMYESTTIPVDWNSYVKRANFVITPSKFCADILSGYNKELYVVEPGIDTDIYTIGEHRENDNFIIGSAGVMSQRKGVDVLVSAFQRTFKGMNDVRLKIKTRDTRWVPPVNDNRIDIIDTDWPEEELAAFYRGLDLFVLPTRGEGFGVTPIEAALCGTPALVTRWSGPTEYIDDKSIFGINYSDLVPVPKHGESGGMMGGGYWAEPDVNDLCELMYEFYTNRTRINLNPFHWKSENAANRLYNVIERYL